MQSAGNDIIALNLIDKQRSNDSRFYSKILSESEKIYYQRTVFAKIDFTCFLWLCWSVKESAYKYLKRIHPELVFSPSKIIVQHVSVDEKNYNGNFLAEGNIYYFRSEISREFITTVVSEDEKFEHVFWGFDSIKDTSADHQSKMVRALLLKKLHTVLPGKKLNVEKAIAGYPIIIEGTKELNIPVSFAHHGRFIAYSFLLPA